MAMPNATLIVQNGGLLARIRESSRWALAGPARDRNPRRLTLGSSPALLGSQQINAVGIATPEPLFPATGKKKMLP